MTAPRPAPPGPRPHAAPRRSWPRRIATIATVGVVAVAVGVAVALVIVKRMRTGEWRAPTMDDLVEIKRDVAQRLDGPPPVPRVIFLDPRPRTLTAGTDDAAAGSSSVIAHQGDAPRDLPGWKGSAKQWRDLVTCVQAQFAAFDVEVTDQPPTTREHVLVAVGGRPKDIGVKDTQVAGLAPFNGEVIPRAVVFAFAATQRHQPRGVCETIAMEVAHAYGLDHEHLCSDVMSYLKPCGKRGFVDKDAPCGEKKPRTCAGGAATQNSFRRLRAVLGPRPAATP
ncbi:MAG: hypothetical protein IPH80_40755 [Myxococcales bacterium]|nr:hypothetical protein [Myxococcales bacterium]